MQDQHFAGSQFPAEMQDIAFITESGPTYAGGPQSNGKRISMFELDAAGNVVGQPGTLVQYVGTGRSSVAGLAPGPDGLYFTSTVRRLGQRWPHCVGRQDLPCPVRQSARRDYDIDGDVDNDDYAVWRQSYGSDLLLAADGNGDGVVNAADYTVWRDALANFSAPPALVRDNNVCPGIGPGSGASQSKLRRPSKIRRPPWSQRLLQRQRLP